MIIIKIPQESPPASAYGIHRTQESQWPSTTHCPLDTAVHAIEPGGTARIYKHHEQEVYLIVRGRGRMTIDSESTEVGPGDVVFMPSFSDHQLQNLDLEAELIFYGLLWKRTPDAWVSNDPLPQAKRPNAPTLVVATPPTPNGDLHLGHLTGPYLRADVYKRYLRMRGVEVLYLTGVDDHQGYVEMAASKEGKDPKKLAGDYGDAIEATLRAMQIDFDHYARPQSSPYHIETVQEFFQELYRKGAVRAREAPTLFCESCDRFITEAEVNGICAHCGQGADGNICEACGRPNDGVDLKDPVCRRCGDKATVRLKERFFFSLASYEELLRSYLQKVPMSSHVEALWSAMMADGLPEISITRITDWGIPLNLPGYEDQRLYAWFEMAPGYLAAARELADKQDHGEAGWRHYWGKSGGYRIVHFFGYDNTYFHTLLFPALFAAYGESIRTPSAFVVNEMYNYEGQKFSTSRRHAVWGRELLGWPGMTVDKARFYLAWNGPERTQSNFRKVDMEEVLQRELIDGWEGWLRDLGVRLQRDFGGILPAVGRWNSSQRRFYKQICETFTDSAEAYDTASFSLRRVTRLLGDLVCAAREFAVAESHWKGIESRFEEWRTAYALEALAAKVLALAITPILPNFAEDLWRALGYEASPTDHGWEERLDFIPSGRDLSGLDRPFFS